MPNVIEDISALLRARNTLLWIVTREEVRAERSIMEAAASASYPTQFWDCARGVTDAKGQPLDANYTDPSQALARLRNLGGRYILVMRDLHKWLDPVVLRTLRSLARDLQNVGPKEARAIVVLSPSAEIPPELADHATVIDFPLPTREEIARLLDNAVSALPPEVAANAAPNGTRDAAIDAAVGLTAAEAENCYARSLIMTRRIDPALVAAEKKRVIAREKVLTWYDPDPRGLEAVGGLDLLKEWLTERKAGFSQKAREFGLPPPKGAMLVGPPGTGKSLTAKCIATAWKMPLLRLDMGALRSKYVGESEQNIRKALQVAETVSPCILWLDEIEKALAGSTGSQGDGGVAADALGAVLSWMQERAGAVFVIATANDVTALPPELLRKGRFDELWFVDLPTRRERGAIVCAAMGQYGRSVSGWDPSGIDRIADVTEGFTGAEIAALVPDALYKAFADGERDVTSTDLVEAARAVVPLSKTATEKIEAVRKWAEGRARRASNPEVGGSDSGKRTLDL